LAHYGPPSTETLTTETTTVWCHKNNNNNNNNNAFVERHNAVAPEALAERWLAISNVEQMSF